MKREGPGFDALRVAMTDLDGLRARVGFFESAHYPDGTSVAYVASIQEFGAGPIPPRSFMRTTVAEQGAKWTAQIAAGARTVLDGKRTAHQVLEIVGLGAAGDIGRKIQQITTPALSLLTLQARKHSGPMNDRAGITGKTLGGFIKARSGGPPDVSGVSTKPLVWTGLMIQSVTAVVDRSTAR